MPIEQTKLHQAAVTDDLDATIINALAATADLHAHYQELVAQEAYLGMSGERRSAAGRQRVVAELRRRLENLKLLLDQLESVIADK